MSTFHVIEPDSISDWIWDNKYRLKDADGVPVDRTIDDTWRRVATAVSAAEDTQTERDLFAAAAFEAMRDFEFLPAGRIIAGAGAGRDVTMVNCFVMGTIHDSMAGIMDSLKDAALTLRSGGGVGMDFSTLRPKDRVSGLSALAPAAPSVSWRCGVRCARRSCRPARAVAR